MISGIIGYGIYFSHYASIKPFQGEPQDNIDILRNDPDINKFYTMYEKYEIEIADMTESQIRFAFMTTDEENLRSTFSIKYFGREPSEFYHTCSQIEPRKRIFSEENYIERHCFENQINEK